MSPSQPPPGNTYDLAPADFNERRTPDDPVLDVRTPDEYGEGHVAGAHNVDVMGPDFQKKVEALDLDQSQPVYLYCRSGGRSGKATGILREMGFSDAHNIGGLHGLVDAGVETEQ